MHSLPSGVESQQGCTHAFAPTAASKVTLTVLGADDGNSVAINSNGDTFYFTASSTTFDFNNGFYEGLSNGTG